MSLVFAVALAASARGEDTLDQVKKDGVLVAGVTADAPPVGFQKEAAAIIVGYDVDFVTASATGLGVKARLRAVTEANRLSELLAGRVDILAAGINHSEARGSFIFSDHYLVSGQKLIARTGTIRRHEDLDNKRIGAVVGTFAESCASDRCKAREIVAFDDYIDGVKALKEGKIDAFTATRRSLSTCSQGSPGAGSRFPIC